jgi:hypothetical protein
MNNIFRMYDLCLRLRGVFMGGGGEGARAPSEMKNTNVKDCYF